MKAALVFLSLIFLSISSFGHIWVWLDRESTFHSNLIADHVKPSWAQELSTLSEEEEKGAALIITAYEGQNISSIWGNLENGGSGQWAFLSPDNRELMINLFKSLIIFNIDTIKDALDECQVGLAHTAKEISAIKPVLAELDAETKLQAESVREIKESLADLEKTSMPALRASIEEFGAESGRLIKEIMGRQEEQSRQLEEVIAQFSSKTVKMSSSD